MSVLSIEPKDLAEGDRHISATMQVELVGAIACIAYFSAWTLGSGRARTFATLLFFTLLCATCSFAGRLCLRILRVFPDGVDQFPLSFLFGFFIINSALYLLAWISPFGIIADSIALIVALAVVGWALGPSRPQAPSDTREDWPSVLCIVVSLIAATLWSQDSLRSLIEGDRVLIFKPWFDCFYHACQIRMLRESHGFSTMQNILMAGQPAPFYHYASYMTPALLSAATGIPPYFAFTCFLVPFGIFLTGLSAFALARSWWGAWAGLGATAALLLLPDASGQGMHNNYMSYYFLQQVNPGGPYGVAIMAISWILMMKGCDSGRPSLIVASFLGAAACIQYKSHIFVANALLLWLFPAFFARKLRWEVRAAWFVFAITSFLAVAKMAQHLPGVPHLQCDYSLSELKSKMWNILSNFDHSTLCNIGSERNPNIFNRFSSETSRLNDLFWGAALLSFVSFGLFGVVSILLALLLLWGRATRDRLSDHADLSFGGSWHRRVRSLMALQSPPASSDPAPGGDPGPRSSAGLAVLIFPILVIANYIIMYLGLELDKKSAPDELIHRPLVWAYFAVSSWAGGALGFVLSESWFLRPIISKHLIIVIIILSFIFPAYYGHNIQQPPESWPKSAIRYAVPRGLLDCSAYIRDRGERDDVFANHIYDNINDIPKNVNEHVWKYPEFFISTWSERRMFVIGGFPPNPKGDPIQLDRCQKIAGFRQLTSLDSIRRFAATNQIRWYVLPPSAPIQWPQSFVDAPVFSSDGYRVYQFW